MSVLSWLNLSFAHSTNRSLPFSRSGSNPQSETRSIDLYLSKFADIQYGSAEQTTARLAFSSPKQHRVRPPPGIQHWFEAFDDCFLDLDCNERLCHLEEEKGHECRIERLSIPKKLFNWTDLTKANTGTPCTSHNHPLKSSPTTKSLLQQDSSPPVVYSTSCCDDVAREGGTISCQLPEAGLADVTSCFNVSLSSTPRSSLDQATNQVSASPLYVNWLQIEDENENVSSEEAELRVDDDSVPPIRFQLHEVAAQQREFQSSLELNKTNRTVSYFPTSCTTGTGEATQPLNVCPISPLDCRFSFMLSQIEFNTESVLLTRRRRHLRPLNLIHAPTIGERKVL